jgi:hypothetical protein
MNEIAASGDNGKLEGKEGIERGSRAGSDGGD